MKAVVFEHYGSPDVLRCEEVQRPAVGEGDVLVKVHAASLNRYDWHFVSGLP